MCDEDDRFPVVETGLQEIASSRQIAGLPLELAVLVEELSQFFQVFFEEAGENLEQMERMLLALDVQAPEDEELNAVFEGGRAALKSLGVPIHSLACITAMDGEKIVFGEPT